jgi:hypothetical protein
MWADRMQKEPRTKRTRAVSGFLSVPKPAYCAGTLRARLFDPSMQLPYPHSPLFRTAKSVTRRTSPPRIARAAKVGIIRPAH